VQLLCNQNFNCLLCRWTPITTVNDGESYGSRVGRLARPVTTSAFLATNPTGDSYLPSCPITSSKWSKKYQSIMLDVRPEWQDTRSLSEAECQFGRLSFFKNAAYRGSLCKLFSRGSTFVNIILGSRWAQARSSHPNASAGWLRKASIAANSNALSVWYFAINSLNAASDCFSRLIEF
jgi:hypothetical protein